MDKTYFHKQDLQFNANEDQQMLWVEGKPKGWIKQLY